MGSQSDESIESNSALEEQQALLEHCLPAVFEAYEDACRRRMSNPVVFLLDCEDEIGGEIARSWLGAEAIEDAIDQRKFQDAASEEVTKTTVFAYGFPFDRCRREVPKVFPYLASVFKQTLPADTFLTISVTSGGASALSVPLSARE